MQSKDFQPDDLSGQIQGLIDGFEVERQARKAAEAADAAKSELLAIIGRELRTPMEAVVSMAELLLAGPLSGTQQRCAATLAQSARNLLGAVNEVVEFAKLEAGEAELETKGFDLHALVKGAASVLQKRASAKGLMSAVDVGVDCPRFIVGDEARVRQVLMGLIESSLQSTSAGSIRLYVSVNDAEEPFTVRFGVTDTGAGLSAAEQESLFRPSADTSRAGGELGMPIARRLAEAMGGEVGCDSALGRGTVYWFTFRAVAAEDVDEVGAEPVVEKPVNDNKAAPKGPLSGHVLVVEDNTVNRMLISNYLDEFGLTHEVVENGASALICLSARTYDLVLMDTVLPDYDGLQIAKRIRSLQAPSCAVPIVALAVNGAKNDDQDFVAAGMNAQVSKPIQGRALYAGLVPFLATRKDREVIANAS